MLFHILPKSYFLAKLALKAHNLFLAIIFRYYPEPSPESRQHRALRLCGGALRQFKGSLTFKFAKNSTNL